jgi:hypothetical protein
MPDMGALSYQGESGGLYGKGANTRPPAHDTAGLALAKAIEARDKQGKLDPNGKYVLLSIGLSNTSMEFQTFAALASKETKKAAKLAIVNGAQGGQSADKWTDPNAMAWQVVGNQLAAADVSAQQVAVAWIKTAHSKPSGGFSQHTKALATDIAAIVRNARAKFPNLAIAYLSSRIYGGYATISINPEPYAYEGGFAVRSVILDQIGGAPTLAFGGAAPQAPCLAWGPYLWADGTDARCDGLSWSCMDLSDDGTHPGESGKQKVAHQLLEFFKTDTTAREWFLESP